MYKAVVLLALTLLVVVQAKGKGPPPEKGCQCKKEIEDIKRFMNKLCIHLRDHLPDHIYPGFECEGRDGSGSGFGSGGSGDSSLRDLVWARNDGPHESGSGSGYGSGSGEFIRSGSGSGDLISGSGDGSGHGQGLREVEGVREVEDKQQLESVLVRLLTSLRSARNINKQTDAIAN